MILKFDLVWLFLENLTDQYFESDASHLSQVIFLKKRKKKHSGLILNLGIHWSLNTNQFRCAQTFVQKPFHNSFSITLLFKEFIIYTLTKMHVPPIRCACDFNMFPWCILLLKLSNGLVWKFYWQITSLSLGVWSVDGQTSGIYQFHKNLKHLSPDSSWHIANKAWKAWSVRTPISNHKQRPTASSQGYPSTVKWMRT